ncbi:MAG: DNA polymerase III subunit delta [Candidatus Uhrbacteria bacterium]|nr:DNA polymerase III subunit delta [Candidatus Uhrbacteria bacterium]
MLIFIYGNNSYLAHEKVKVMREKFLEKFDKSGMNLAHFDIGAGSFHSFGDVMQAVKTPPFLGEKRMVIISGLLSLKKAEAEPWAESLVNVPESTIVILQDDVSVKMGAKHHLLKVLGSGEDVHTYPMEELTGSQLSVWATSHAKGIGLNIDSRLLQKVVSMVGGDLWQLSGELDKLAGHSLGLPVTEEMVRNLVRANFEDQMFNFIDAVANKNSSQALALLHEQRLAGSADFHLFAMLARQIRILLGVRDVLDRNPQATKADVASALNVHPFVAQKSLAQARRMEMAQLRNLHNMLFEFDHKLKSSGISAEVAVDRFVAEMLA